MILGKNGQRLTEPNRASKEIPVTPDLISISLIKAERVSFQQINLEIVGILMPETEFKYVFYTFSKNLFRIHLNL